ncbi:MAG: carboxyl-terminal processing protease [Parcubacteria bacterium C7867-005]|nr:MAG: carboxyl-terminal processing protease [Parcubacteria bacterium C7867-005]
MDQHKKVGSRIFLIIILVSLVFYWGFYLGKSSIEAAESPTSSKLENITENKPSSVDFAPFWKAWNLLNEKYVPSATSSKEITDEDKVWGAISGLASSLGDPYTVFFPPTQSELFAADIRGNFEGVGMELTARDGALVVIAPLKGSPAEKSGLLPGDRILKIDDKDTGNISTEDAVKLIRGPKGTEVKFSISRTGRAQAFIVSVIRDTIDIPTIDTKNLGNDIFKIDLYSFTAGSPNLFRKALREFVESGSHKLVLDLRGNPGGYLEAAIDMASWFLPSGKIVVRENFGEGKEEIVYRSKGYDVFTDKLKFVVLVDGGSASASEIFAGAVKEHKRAVIVGEKTFGKGSVQELVDITSKTSLKITIARWLTPDGTSISKDGVVPDFEVKRTEADVKAGKDPQLEKALEILNN